MQSLGKDLSLNVTQIPIDQLQSAPLPSTKLFSIQYQQRNLRYWQWVVKQSTAGCVNTGSLLAESIWLQKNKSRDENAEMRKNQERKVYEVVDPSRGTGWVAQTPVV
jgi:hypothetical protein